mgnify:CR=1 FL=1
MPATADNVRACAAPGSPCASIEAPYRRRSRAWPAPTGDIVPASPLPPHWLRAPLRREKEPFEPVDAAVPDGTDPVPSPFRERVRAVSYTHLTLPTIYSV